MCKIQKDLEKDIGKEDSNVEVNGAEDKTEGGVNENDDEEEEEDEEEE